MTAILEQVIADIGRHIDNVLVVLLPELGLVRKELLCQITKPFSIDEFKVEESDTISPEALCFTRLTNKLESTEFLSDRLEHIQPVKRESIMSPEKIFYLMFLGRRCDVLNVLEIGFYLTKVLYDKPSN